jgi:hypothetical protein
MVTLCPSEVPDAHQRLHACSERPRAIEHKIAEDGLAERFCLLANLPILAQNDRRHEARCGSVLAGGERMETVIWGYGPTGAKCHAYHSAYRKQALCGRRLPLVEEATPESVRDDGCQPCLREALWRAGREASS